jgi:general secretion pathway protein N
MKLKQLKPQKLGAGAFTFVVACALFCALAVIVLSAPASLVDIGVNQATQGRLRLADTQGTVWRGSGRIVLADVAAEASSYTVTGLVLPGTFEWTIAGLPLFIGRVNAQLSGAGLITPIKLEGGLGSVGELKISASRLVLPTVDLSRMGSPWNTFKPQASLDVQWDNMTLREGQFTGKAVVELKDIASALTSVRPLGSYKVDVVGAGSSADVKLLTTQGPLSLTGNGVWNARQGLRLSIEALADETAKVKLQTLLSLMGRREGEKTIIRIGA